MYEWKRRGRDATNTQLRQVNQRRVASGRKTDKSANLEATRMGRFGHGALWILAVLMLTWLVSGSEEASLPHRSAPVRLTEPVVANSGAAVTAGREAAGVAAEQPGMAGPELPAAIGSSPPATDQPSETVEKTTQLTLEPSDNGNFYVRGAINGEHVTFLLDTGASWISIPERLRWKLKLERGRYLRVATASGIVGNYETRVPALDIGPFHWTGLVGALNPYAPNDVVLLGMNALKDVECMLANGQLVLSQRQPTAERSLSAPTITAAPPLVMRRSVRECMGPGRLIDSSSLECLAGR